MPSDLRTTSRHISDELRSRNAQKGCFKSSESYSQIPSGEYTDVTAIVFHSLKENTYFLFEE